MKEATLIIDSLLQLIRDMEIIQSADQVVDSDPQIDEFTPFPVIHLREIDETAPTRRGIDYKRTRNLQIDIYQPSTVTRADRNELLDSVLKVIFHKPTGLKLEGTTLIHLTVGTISLEPDEPSATALITQIPLAIEYASHL